jgi:alcohol dehydrogenase, propanol-preferring
MSLMKAIHVNTPGADFELIEKEIPEPKENEVLIRIKACGVCHGDVIAKEGHFPGLTYPGIPGHEVAGVITRTGSQVKGWTMGEKESITIQFCRNKPCPIPR